MRAEGRLQDGGGHGEPAGAAGAAEEVPVGRDDGAPRLGDVRLQRDQRRLEDEADADADDGQDHDDDGDVGVAVERAGEAGATRSLSLVLCRNGTYRPIVQDVVASGREWEDIEKKKHISRRSERQNLQCPESKAYPNYFSITFTAREILPRGDRRHSLHSNQSHRYRRRL